MTSIVEQATSKDIHLAATLIVVTPIADKTSGYNYKLLMVKQSSVSLFSNAHVFPGGEVCQIDEQWKINGIRKPPSKICAIRETFKETGLLLTHPPAHTILTEADLKYWREIVLNDPLQFKTMCDAFELKPATDILIPFASVITPFTFPRRHKTQIYITVLDSSTSISNVGSPNGKTTVQLDWFIPRQVLTCWDKRIIFVHTLQWYYLGLLVGQITDYKSINPARIGALRQQNNQLSVIMPQFGSTGSENLKKFSHQSYWTYPGDEDYIDVQTGMPSGKLGDRHRIYIRGWSGDYTLERNIEYLHQCRKSNL